MEKLIRSLTTYSLLLLFGISAQYGVAQGSPLLGKFSLTPYEGGVLLYWQILAGSSCNGVQIYRSVDSIDFERIGYIPGICGHEYEDSNFYFTDSMPVQNAVNYYYLELGTVGVSDVIAIEVIPSGNKGYQIRPHPVVDQARIYFDPIAHDGHVLKVYDLAGREVLSSETLDAYFDMNTATLPSGLYPFTITSSGNSARIEGIFLVQH